MKTTSIAKHIFWSCREQPKIDMNDPAQKKWFLERTLSNGTIEDICVLNLNDVEAMLPNLHLPRHVRMLWRDYFDNCDTDTVSPEDS